MRTLAAVTAIFSIFPLTHAQVPLVTDRPDQTESAVVVPAGSVQVETGVRFSAEEDGTLDVDVSQILATLARFGVTERFEFRLGIGGWTESSAGSAPDVSGVGDASFGFKLSLAHEEGSRPETALIASTSLPTGAERVGGRRADPTVLFAFSHTLSDRLGVGYNAGVGLGTQLDADGSRDTGTDALGTVSVGYALADRLGAFVELFGSAPFQSGQAAATFDTGITYRLRPAVQLDLSAGVGLTDTAEDWFVGAGLSGRF